MTEDPSQAPQGAHTVHIQSPQDTIVVGHAADRSTDPPLASHSPPQPSENNRGDIPSPERLVHTAQETLHAVQQIQRQRPTPPPEVDMPIQRGVSPSCFSNPYPIQGEAGNGHLGDGPPVVNQILDEKRGSSGPLPNPAPLETRSVLYSPYPRPLPKKGLAASLEHASLGAGQLRLQKEGHLALRKLKLLGQLLVPRRGGSGLWSMDVDDLMLQDLTKFCNCISRITGLPKVFELSFELLDLNINNPYIIGQGDSQAFHSLKLTILNGLLILLDADPGLDNFRIQVTVPNRSQRRGVPAPTAGRYTPEPATGNRNNPQQS